MHLLPGSRVAVIGAGPGGLAAAKHAIEAGFRPTVFEASDDLGGQWHTAAAHSGVWPGMRTNTSRAMTAFSDFPVPPSHALHPLAEQVQAYLRAYAVANGVDDCIRFGTRVREIRPVSGQVRWSVDGEAFDAVVVATGRFGSPLVPAQLAGFTGELLHAFDYPGAAPFRDRRVLVYGNGVSGHEIASDLASASSGTVVPVTSAYRKPRYVLQKVVDGVPSDWQWYTHVGALLRAGMEPGAYDRMLRTRVVRVAGNPADFGAPEPDPSIGVAGHSLCQDYLAQVRAGAIVCRPGIASVDGRRVTFTDGTTGEYDAVISATGYRLDVPFLSPEVRALTGPDLRLHLRTFHPDLPGLGVIGQYGLQGPYLPLLELQARWIAGVWSGAVPPPDEADMRASIALAAPVTDSHHVLARRLAEASGVAPDLRARPELTEALLMGPLLPVRYRLDGPGALADAASRFTEQLEATPRAPVEPDDLAELAALGLTDLAKAVDASVP